MLRKEARAVPGLRRRASALSLPPQGGSPAALPTGRRKITENRLAFFARRIKPAKALRREGRAQGLQISGKTPSGP